MVEMREGERLMVANKTRVLVPLEVRKELLQHLHLAHQGNNCVYAAEMSRYFWQGLKEKVAKMTRSCQVCVKYYRPRPAEDKLVDIKRHTRFMEASATKRSSIQSIEHKLASFFLFFF